MNFEDFLKRIMNSIHLLLDKEVTLELQSFITFVNGQGSSSEFEVRFQDLTRTQFNSLVYYINLDNYFQGNKKEIKSVSTIFPNNMRVETFGEPNTKDFRQVFQNKKETKSLKLLVNNSPIKLSVSKENIVKESQVTDKNSKLIRKKTRTRYIFNDYYIDLTYSFNTDKVNNKDYETFEVEIEFKDNKNVNMENLIIPIKYILKMLKIERFSFMDETSEYEIRRNYLKLFPDVQSSHPKYIYENKPSNFKLEYINDFNHSITNKLNGINYFLFYNSFNNSLYLINSTKVEYLGKDKLNKLKRNFLIQGELYFEQNTKKYIFYIFDVLIVDGNKVTNQFHKSRLDTFFPYFGIIDENLFLNDKPITIQYKTFFGIDGINKNDPNDNFYNNLIKCEYSLQKDANGNIDMELNDGFIFTPLDRPYINKETYKYKFPETMTIDFSVKLSKKDNINFYYSIYVYNRKKQLIPFLNNKYILMCSLSKNGNLCNDIKDNNIVECLFNSNEKVFTPYRIRDDKNLPNFYEVAESVFQDIIEPITLNKLENVFKDKFDRGVTIQSLPPPSKPSSPVKIVNSLPKKIIMPDLPPLENVISLTDKPSSRIPRKGEFYSKPKIQLPVVSKPPSPIRPISPSKEISSFVQPSETYLLSKMSPAIQEQIYQIIEQPQPEQPQPEQPQPEQPQPQENGEEDEEEHEEEDEEDEEDDEEEDEDDEEIEEEVFKPQVRQEIITTDALGVSSPSSVIIENLGETLKVKINTLLESVLFSVSPEYRSYSKNNNEKRDLMLETTLEILSDTKFSYRLDDINVLGNIFNIRVHLLRDRDNSYEIIKKSTNQNGKNNKLYIVKRNNYYDVLGYTENGYEMFIF